MVFKQSYLFPIIFSVSMPITFVITYTCAVLNKDVVPVFPYVSDTGSWSPESCIFGLFLAIGAIFLVLTVYVRYRQIRELCEKNEFKPYIKKLNTFSIYLGMVASFGVVVVGSFQETNVLTVHALGALMCFGGGSIYHVIQVAISFAVYPTFGKKALNIFRVICTFLYLVSFSVTGIFTALAFSKFEGDDMTKWDRQHGGYDLHLVATISEWIMLLFNQIIIFIFSFEFKLLQFNEPKIIAVTS